MIKWKISLIKSSANGIPYALKLTFDFKDDGLTKEECEFLQGKIKEYVKKNNEYKFDYFPACTVTTPKKKFRTVIAERFDPNTDEEEYINLFRKFLKECIPKFIKFYEEQKKQYQSD